MPASGVVRKSDPSRALLAGDVGGAGLGLGIQPIELLIQTVFQMTAAH